MKLTSFLDDNCKSIIHELNDEFDSHDFINEFLKSFEKEYVECLYEFKEAKGIFRSFHSQIGKYLEKNSSSMLIEKLVENKSMSNNVKGYESSNQKWRKIL